MHLLWKSGREHHHCFVNIHNEIHLLHRTQTKLADTAVLVDAAVDTTQVTAMAQQGNNRHSTINRKRCTDGEKHNLFMNETISLQRQSGTFFTVTVQHSEESVD